MSLHNIKWSARLAGSVEYVKLTISGELAELIEACAVGTGHAVLDDGDCACGWVGAMKLCERPSSQP